MKNKGRLFYFLICLVIIGFLGYKGTEYGKELLKVKRESRERQDKIMKDINEKYYPREKDFFENGEARNGI